jgi:hypothetical protein
MRVIGLAVVLGLSFAPLIAEAQVTGQRHRVGFLKDRWTVDDYTHLPPGPGEVRNDHLPVGLWGQLRLVELFVLTGERLRPAGHHTVM